MTSLYDYPFVFKIVRGSHTIKWPIIKSNRYWEACFSESPCHCDVILMSSNHYHFVFKIVRGSYATTWPNIKSNRCREVCFSKSRYDVIVTSCWRHYMTTISFSKLPEGDMLSSNQILGQTYFRNNFLITSVINMTSSRRHYVAIISTPYLDLIEIRKVLR